MAKVLGDQKKMKIFLPTGLGIQDPLPVAINGAVMAIPVGREVEVPEAVYKLVMKQSNVFDRHYGKTGDVEQKALSNKPL